MAQEDWAVIVGITHYPELGNLDGSEIDAKQFYKWVISQQGGDVPTQQAKLICSSEFSPPFASVTDALPAIQEIHREFERLQDIAEHNVHAGKKRRVGRRLYLYMGGHGIAPRKDQTALLTANATRLRMGYHVLGQYNADWFLISGYFDEVLLFMDCCRAIYQVPSLNMLYGPVISRKAIDYGIYFYGFGTKWSRLSRERRMEDGETHGVFTMALLRGLEGAAANPDTGQITAASLADYLYNNTKDFLSATDQNDNDIPKEPDCEYPVNHGHDLVIATVPVQYYVVNIDLTNCAKDSQIKVLNNKFEEVADTIVSSLNSLKWKLKLKRGMYLLLELAPNNQRKAIFDVKGTGGVDVQLQWT